MVHDFQGTITEWHADKAAVIYNLNTPVSSDKQQSNALINAATRGNTADIRKLLKDGADINAADSAGFTPLMHAVKNRNLKAAADLIAAGADLAVETRNRKSIYALAIETGSPTIIALLSKVLGVPDVKPLLRRAG